ncbi:hypothetical protein AHMF7605_03415 [Adhaeribacter arboris]|uniref:Uncharacterized protein n=1 Tax=Adhaeribacter arboris TaxID=2072846 RepID=A0A2T2YAT8_9BACT|nr:hypothetical protein AHMF7605_03415 [Adhaeribacter arboris]
MKIPGLIISISIFKTPICQKLSLSQVLRFLYLNAMQFKIAFNQYVAVQHKLTLVYFVNRVAENKNFDTAAVTDTYKCHSVRHKGTIITKLPILLL